MTPRYMSHTVSPARLFLFLSLFFIQLGVKGQPTLLQLVPADTLVDINDIFTVVVQVNATPPRQVDGGEVHLNFDPNVLEVLSLRAGSSLPITLVAPNFDNTLGRIAYAAGVFSPRPTGTFDLLTIVFRAKGGSQGSGINYEFTIPSRNTSVTSGGLDVLDGTDTSRIEVYEPYVAVSPRVLLEGAKADAGSLLRDDLRQGAWIPMTEPYTAAGFTQVGQGGGESLSPGLLGVGGNDALVDWVFLELRNGFIPSVVFATSSGLLQRDGDIIAPDGSSEIRFMGILPGSYYLVVKHRNHLGVMSATPLSMDTARISVDFTSPSQPIFGFSNYRINLNGSGLLALPTGDINASGGIDLSDRNDCWNARNQEGYLSEDVDLDGKVSASDRVQCWNNRGISSTLP